MATIEDAPLGSLRSQMRLTLHTLHAIRLWNGRLPSADAPRIRGLNDFVTLVNRVYRDAARDDPYADALLLRFEAKLDSTRTALLNLHAQLNAAMAQAPAAFSLGDNLNVEPVQLPVTFNAPLGFLALYLLADYDELARRALLAQHTALIDPPTLEYWLDEGAHCLRSLFSLIQTYRTSGACRDDFAANNAKAQRAREQFGELPQNILDGSLRARHAPALRQSEPAALNSAGPTSNNTHGLPEDS
ncbi:PFL_4669 family integrating conjugative element protein [Pseudomonas sp. ICMP 8385]|uniref:PFL_4669 family integrating conjugative element protein n=1 Tax=Pseudomonas sp. ICMP 8385 TaxID=1718920 RepID=UPI000C083A59|nr:TIGR03761 family integrating conjugative element protein [Pseudomonas sp. ICMP 8385]